MKSPDDNSTKSTETAAVDAYMQNSAHPLIKVIERLREIILKTDTNIGEEIKWNAPAFFYKGAMKPFNPKEYKRHIIVFNAFKKDCIRLVFLSGAKVEDTSGLLEGSYPDGRRLALFHNMEDVRSKENMLQEVIRKWLKLLDK